MNLTLCQSDCSVNSPEREQLQQQKIEYVAFEYRFRIPQPKSLEGKVERNKWNLHHVPSTGCPKANVCTISMLKYVVHGLVQKHE